MDAICDCIECDPICSVKCEQLCISYSLMEYCILFLEILLIFLTHENNMYILLAKKTEHGER